MRGKADSPPQELHLPSVVVRNRLVLSNLSLRSRHVHASVVDPEEDTQETAQYHKRHIPLIHPKLVYPPPFLTDDGASQKTGSLALFHSRRGVRVQRRHILFTTSLGLFYFRPDSSVFVVLLNHNEHPPELKLTSIIHLLPLFQFKLEETASIHLFMKEELNGSGEPFWKNHAGINLLPERLHHLLEISTWTNFGLQVLVKHKAKLYVFCLYFLVILL